MDRRRDQRAWRSARSHPSAHRRSIAAARHGGGPRIPLIAASAPANGGNHAGGYDREEAARRLWRRCRPIDGTHAEAYLHARAIGHCRFPALRFHPDLIHRGDDGIHRLPALVAAVTGDDGAVEGVQRTWLDPKRPEKANLARPRKALGRVHGRAVRFGGFASGATLLAGEGIETVLSVVTAVPGIHAAAALSAGSLGAFEPPQDLALLVIARDKDVEGGNAANRLQRRCSERRHSLNRDRSRTLRF